jgi:hypothetical protein
MRQTIKRMSQTIKAAALYPIFAATATIFSIFSATAMASAAPLVDCSIAVENARALAANIAGGANTYWAHRANFVDFKFGRLRDNPNATALAEAEKSLAAPVKAAMPNNLAAFQAALAPVRSQKCLAAAELRAIEETATTDARKINFDLFPDDETEATSPGPKKMPP